MIYTDEYNIAYNYLKEKYGYKRVCHTAKFSERLRKCATAKERFNMAAAATDDDYVIALNPIPDDDIEGKTIKLMLGQYYYGYSIKKELRQKMRSMGLMAEV